MKEKVSGYEVTAKDRSVVCQQISKSYGKVKALTDISFTAERGEIFGIIGPDGAGKTTLFRILTTLILADSGKAQVDGYDVVKDYKEIRKRVGYMPGRFSLYMDLTVEENLSFFATVFNTTIEENYHLVKDIYQQIEPFKNRKAGDLSGGMKQKLALSCALIHQPDVLFLDEPTTGVDPVSRKELWAMLKNLKTRGITILVSTSYMDEASLCDRIALIREGRFLITDSPENITRQYTKTLWAISGAKMSKLLTDLRQHPAITHCYTFGDCLHATLRHGAWGMGHGAWGTGHRAQGAEQGAGGTEASMDEMKLWLTGKGHTDIKIREIQPGIEDCFMELTE
jgi:ABC-2 type transport system ATP-binding protein